MPRPKGFKHSKETKDKISKSLLGHKVSEETLEKMSIRLKGRLIWNKGIVWNIEIKNKISKTNKEKGIEPKEKFIAHKENHWNWKNGITPENILARSSIEYRLWREAVFARDGWACLNCGDNKNKFNAHHIKNFSEYPELRFAIDNGITLCKNCHNEFHKLYGTKNNTKEQLEEFIGRKLL